MCSKSYLLRDSLPPYPAETIRLSLGPVFRVKNANAWERLANIDTFTFRVTMPFDNRRIAGPEETQPVVFGGEKCSYKPLVTTGMYFVYIISEVCNVKLFSCR